MKFNAQPRCLAAAIAVALPFLLAAGAASAGFQMQVPLGNACAHGACSGGTGTGTGGTGTGGGVVTITENFDGVTPNANPILYAESMLCGIGGGWPADPFAASAPSSFGIQVNTSRTCGGLNAGGMSAIAVVEAGATSASVQFNLAVIDPTSTALATVTLLDANDAVVVVSSPVALAYGAWQPVSVALPGPGTYKAQVYVTRTTDMSSADLKVYVDDLVLKYTPAP